MTGIPNWICSVERTYEIFQDGKAPIFDGRHTDGADRAWEESWRHKNLCLTNPEHCMYADGEEPNQGKGKGKGNQKEPKDSCGNDPFVSD